MKKIILFAIISIFFLSIFSCDKIEGPYKESFTIIEKDTVRKTIVMDFTGINCTNCPDGHVAIDSLIDKYGHRIIPLALHVPFLSHINGYTFDLVSQAATDFWPPNFNSFIGIPAGLINSMKDSVINNPLDWENEVVKYVNLDPTCIITIENTLNNKTLSINVETTFISDISSPLNLVVYITENNIIGPQNDHGVINENYIHKHVVRDCLNTINGDEVATSVSKDQKITKPFTTTINDLWNENEVSVVAFIYNSDKEIIQAEEKSIIE